MTEKIIREFKVKKSDLFVLYYENETLPGFSIVSGRIHFNGGKMFPFSLGTDYIILLSIHQGSSAFSIELNYLYATGKKETKISLGIFQVDQLDTAISWLQSIRKAFRVTVCYPCIKEIPTETLAGLKCIEAFEETDKYFNLKLKNEKGSILSFFKKNGQGDYCGKYALFSQDIDGFEIKEIKEGSVISFSDFLVGIIPVELRQEAIEWLYCVTTLMKSFT